MLLLEEYQPLQLEFELDFSAPHIGFSPGSPEWIDNTNPISKF